MDGLDCLQAYVHRAVYGSSRLFEDAGDTERHVSVVLAGQRPDSVLDDEGLSDP